MHEISGNFPELSFSERNREFNLYSEQKRIAAVYHYLVSGFSFRRLDREILNCSFQSDGWQSMGICHHLGLHNPHKGFFQGWNTSDILHYLYRLSKDPDICIIYYYIVRYLETFSSITDAERNEVSIMERTSPSEELFEKNWIKNTLLRGADDIMKIDAAILKLPEEAASETRIAVREVECFIRSSTIREAVKSLYDYRCQVCGDVVLRYGWKQMMPRKEEWKYLSSDVHHILPLSDGGPDSRRNMLCLCPTCHRKFHSGEYRIKASGNMLSVSDELLGKRLQLSAKHEIELY